MIEAITQQYSTIVLVLMLAAVFVIAFKVMELVFETLTVSALSGGFYVAYTVLIGGGMEQIVLNDLLLFAVLGAAFYMAYSFLSSAYTYLTSCSHGYTEDQGELHHLSVKRSPGKKNMKRFRVTYPWMKRKLMIQTIR